MNKPRSHRSDGWTESRRTSFIAALASGARLRAAATGAGPSVSSAYRLYKRDPAFAAAWDAATAPHAAYELPDRYAALSALSTRDIIRRLERQAARGRVPGLPGW